MSTLDSPPAFTPGLQPSGLAAREASPASGSATDAPARAKVRRTGLWLGLLAAVALALALLIASALASLADSGPLTVHVDGEELFDGLELAALSFGELFALGLGLLLALLVSLVVVPLAVALGLAAAALGLVLAVVLGLGLPLLIVVGLGALLLSPLILAGWLLVKLLG